MVPSWRCSRLGCLWDSPLVPFLRQCLCAIFRQLPMLVRPKTCFRLWFSHSQDCKTLFLSVKPWGFFSYCFSASRIFSRISAHPQPGKLPWTFFLFTLGASHHFSGESQHFLLNNLFKMYLLTILVPLLGGGTCYLRLVSHLGTISSHMIFKLFVEYIYYFI